MVTERHNPRHLPWPLLEGTWLTQSNSDTELRDDQPTSVFRDTTEILYKRQLEHVYT
jgi:hypothetical protein